MTIKNLLFAVPALIATLVMTTSGQVKSVAAANNQTASKPAATSQNPSNGTRVRVLGQDTSAGAPSGNISTAATLNPTAKADFDNHTETSRVRRRNSLGEKENRSVAPGTDAGPSNEKRSALANTTGSSSSSTLVSGSPNVLMASTQVYRIGPNDVLDIQLASNPSRKSTLFTVLAGGLLEYPLAGDPIPVAGLTTAEIAAVLRQRIKIFENPAVVVNVRDYASHTVTITGFVATPGTKALRREAVPLYAMLSEVVALPEAERATITRQGRPTMVLDLTDPNHSSTLVVAGDVIKVLGAAPPPSEFFFVGEGLNSPGQKPYHDGLTLTQAILASGGVRVSAGSKVRISRQRADGRLANEDYDLRKIQSGKIPDPILQKGDRIEVTGNN
ncbi:MAG: polysaccharide biosynthesis/export family protein [Acidobacteriota bacterium]|nr:polysaccharide biosynthesis/export family protein [Acidobacteriota bacterium]